MPETTQQSIIQELERGGFQYNHDLENAVRHFESAVGPKVGIIWVTLRNGRFWISGHFYSEGRNILEPLDRLIDANADEISVRTVLDAYLGRVLDLINNSYAVRLLRPRAA